MNKEDNDYQDEEYSGEIEQVPFSILNVLRNEAEKESTVIQDLDNLIRFIYNEINNKSTSTKEELVKLYNMVFELLDGIQYINESFLSNNEIMSNLFELYQISDELRYYFALFNGDIKMKLNKIIESTTPTSADNNNNNKPINYFNNKDNQINYESVLFKSFINHNSSNNNNNSSNNNSDQNKIIELFNYNRSQVNSKLNNIIKNEEELKSIKDQLQNELNTTKKDIVPVEQEQKSSASTSEREIIERSFFIIFQIFTSYLYNLQSLGEKLLLSLQDFSDSSSDKKELYITLINRDLINLNSVIQLLKIAVNQQDQFNTQQEFNLNIFNKLQLNNNHNHNNKDQPTSSFTNSVLSVIQNYINNNNLNEESILEYLNN